MQTVDCIDDEAVGEVRHTGFVVGVGVGVGVG